MHSFRVKADSYPLAAQLHMMLWVILMDPCGLNVLIAAISNYFYTELSKDEFVCLGVFLNELSKSMISTALFHKLCYKEDLHVS